jgi:ribosomal protein S12 methylthiotransferase accessory factor
MRRSVYQPGADRRQPALDWSWIDSRYPRRSFLTVPHHEGDTFQSDLNWLLGRLRGVGLRRVVIVDLRRPEFGIPVVRVVVPGLEAAMIEPGAVALGARALAVIAGRT